MGEAKRKAGAPVEVVYHHTSTLRTNLIWMSGVIDLEGRSEGVKHPLMGEVRTDVTQRRPCIDFPALAWFTNSIRIPKVLLDIELIAAPKTGGAPRPLSQMFGSDQNLLANGMALHRVALGFPTGSGPIIPWRDHPGFQSAEGQGLNETARRAGDDPDRWYVSEVPVDVRTATEVWVSGSIFKPKLESRPEYLKEVHRMVDLCRAMPDAFIPPTWLGNKDVEQMIAMHN